MCIRKGVKNYGACCIFVVVVCRDWHGFLRFRCAAMSLVFLKSFFPHLGHGGIMLLFHLLSLYSIAKKKFAFFKNYLFVCFIYLYLIQFMAICFLSRHIFDCNLFGPQYTHNWVFEFVPLLQFIHGFGGFDPLWFITKACIPQ